MTLSTEKVYIQIPSKVVKRGNSIYVLIPPAIRHNYDLKTGVKCNIIPDTHNRIHITFE